jgi:hypothetical protein
VLKLGKIQRRLEQTHRIELLADDTVVDTIAARCTEVESGATSQHRQHPDEHGGMLPAMETTDAAAPVAAAARVAGRSSRYSSGAGTRTSTCD